MNARLHGRDPGWTWALRDVDFSVQPGESVGIVGANGSGKTTLLRLLSGVMFPYAGKLEVSGRVGALIEVRAGIHPELTGRENVFVYGTLLGLTRRAVAKRFDEIVEFAQVEHAIDRQVKHYSSGMQMRLGFAVAAFLEPAILMVDEILAVGDASFQQRCLERMREVLALGTTLLYVSHDLATVEATCTRAIWLDGGVLAEDGEARAVLGSYRSAVQETAEFRSPQGSPVQIVDVSVSGGDGSQWPRTQGPVEIRVVMDDGRTDEDKSSSLMIGVSEGTASPIFVLRRVLERRSGKVEIRCTIPHLPLPRGRFYLWLGVFKEGRDVLPWYRALSFDVVGSDLDHAPKAIVRLAPVHVDSEWVVEPSNGHADAPGLISEPLELGRD